MSEATELERWLDQLYREGPPPEAAQRALAGLQAQAQTWQPALWYGLLPKSVVGPLLVAVSDQGVTAVEFGKDEVRFVRRLRQGFGATARRSPDRVAPVLAQLEEYLQGRRARFDLAVDLKASTEFQRRVLGAAAGVPRGRLASYGEIAARIGSPRAARAVGQALARNPVPIIVPCHRVVAADGTLTGYSGGAGVETKARLLRLEGAAIG